MPMSSSSNQPSDKRMRAIDRLDQHMMKRSMSNSRSSSPSGPFPSWLSRKISSVPSYGQYGNQDYEIGSPSPKRRKAGSLSPTRNIVPATNGRSNTFPFETRMVTSVQSSPIKKTVAFSDTVESSPTQQSPKSSPRPSSLQKPVKSILRNADRQRKAASDMGLKKDTFLNHNNEKANSLEINPYNLNYWVGGEVHSMIDPNSANEFFNIIDGGLEIVSQKTSDCSAKRFEVYATFNNIVPPVSAKGGNDAAERKVNVLIDQMGIIVNVCLPHLQEEQGKLLSTSEKKDPFSSRLYVQIIRLFEFLLSNFKILKWLMNKPQLQTKLKSIYELTFEALTHINTNKVMVAAQISFLANIKFGTYFLNSDEITRLIRTIPHIKEIQSTNLVNEKLNLVKSLISKYPGLMIDNLSTWFCGEVLPIILIENEVNNSKIVTAAVSAALDLLKKCLEFSKGYEDIYKYLQFHCVDEVVPKKIFDKIALSQDGNSDDISHQTLFQLLKKQIKYLIITKQEYKISMDLWLALTGLLYNNIDRLEFLSKHIDNEWLDLNLLCYQAPSAQAKLISIKVWRILVYSICIHLEGLTTRNIKVVKLLQRPFEFTQENEYDLNVREGLVFYLTGIVYVAFSETTNLSNEKFGLFWEYALKPIYLNRIFQSPSIQLKNRSITLLLKLLGSKVLEQQTNQHQQHQQDKQHTNNNKNSVKKGLHLTRIIVPTGVNARDIQALPTNIIKANFDTIQDLIFGAIRCNLSNLNQNSELITALLKHLPNKFASERRLKEFVDVIMETLFERKDDKNLGEYFVQLTCCLTLQFTPSLFNDLRNFQAYLHKFDLVFSLNPETKVKLLKELIVGLRGKVPEFFLTEAFLDPINLPIKKYVSNWIGSMLLSPTIPYEHFYSLVRIVNAIPTTEVLQNFLNLTSKVPFNIDLLQLLSVKNWDNKELTSFVKSSIIKNLNSNKPELYSFLHYVLAENEQLFSHLLPLLCKLGHYGTLRSVLADRPRLLDRTLAVDKESFAQILPLEMLPFFLKNIYDYEKTVQFRIIQWAIEHNQTNTLFGNRIVLDKCLFEECENPEDAAYRKRILSDLLSSLLLGKKWNFLSLIVLSCMKNNEIDHLSANFSKENFMPLLQLSPKALASMTNGCGSLNPALIQAIKRCFITKGIQFNVALIEELIIFSKFELFILCGKEIVTFFLINSNSHSNVEEAELLVIFERLLISLMDQKKSLVLDFVEEITERLPEDPNGYLLKIISTIKKQLQVNLQKLKKETRFPRAYRRLEELENQEKSHSLNFQSETQEGSTETQSSSECVRPPEGLNNSEISEAVAGKVQKAGDIQVNATQEKHVIQRDQSRPHNQAGDQVSSVVSDAPTEKEGTGVSKEESINARRTGLSLEDAIDLEDLESNLPHENIGHKTLDTFPSNHPETHLQANGRESSNKKRNASIPYDPVRDESSVNSREIEDENFSEFLGAMEFRSAPERNSGESEDAREEKNDNLKGRSPTTKADDTMNSFENKEESQMLGIKIPIFNSSKLQSRASSRDPSHRSNLSEQKRKRVDNDDEDNEDGDNGNEEQDIDVSRDTDLLSSQVGELPSSQENESNFLQDSKRSDWAPQNIPPSLRLHFPTRKSRKLVHRLRGFSLDDIAKISPEEKRNLRIELLDFMMKLEHESLTEEF